MGRITETDIKWACDFYPGLRIGRTGALSGHLRFRATYEEKPNGKIRIFHENFCGRDGALGEFIEDTYRVSVAVKEDDPMPRVWEIGGRLKAQVKTMEKSLADLHMYPDESLCLGNPVRVMASMASNGSLQNYFEQWLIPYLYYRSYLEKFSREPWDGLPHGPIGIMEDFSAPDEMNIADGTFRILSECFPDLFQKISASKSSKERYGPNEKCICGSGVKFMRCHPKALVGYKNLRKSFLKIQGDPELAENSTWCHRSL